MEFGGYTTARLGDRSVAGIVGSQPDAPPTPAAWGLYFAADDIDAAVASAVAQGAQVLYPAMAVGEFGSMAVCVDPAGAQFCLWQAGSHVGTQVTDEPGATTWFELYSPNAKLSCEFYTTILGATADPMPGGTEYYVLKHGENQLGGIMQIDPAWGAIPAHWITYFAVADAEATVARVIAHGGKQFGGIDDTPFGRIAALADPQGAMFKIADNRLRP